MDATSLAAWGFAVSALVLLLAAAAQAALVYIDRARLRHLVETGTPRASALAELLDAPTSTLSTVLLIYTFCLVTATVSGMAMVQAWWDPNRVVAIVLLVLGFLFLLLIQFVGRVVAVAQPERVALAFVRPVELLSRVFAFVLIPLLAFERLLVRALGLRRSTTPAEAEERLRHLVEDTSELEEDERDMIASVIELGDEPVREVMVPRIDIKALPASATIREAMDRIIDTGHSRIPLFAETIDHVTGMVYAKDLLRHLRDGAPTDAVAALAREPLFVPETKKVDELLQEMRTRRMHMAIVADEYGGTAGLITIEDLIEEIVGEIQDEYDLEEAPIEQVSATEAVFDARVSIRDVNDVLDVEIDDEDFDTIGGLLYHQLRKVPVAGDQLVSGPLTITVLQTTGRRIKKVRVIKALAEPAPTERTERP